MDEIWLQAKNDYICGKGSLPKLAQKYGLKIDALKKRSAAEHWKAERDRTTIALNEQTVRKTVRKTVQKTVQKVAERASRPEGDRLARLMAIADQMAAKLEQAVNELGREQRVKKLKHRVSKQLEDENGKPYIDEWTTETDESWLEDAQINRYALRQLAATLKDLQSIVAYANGDGEEQKEIRVVIEGDDGGDLSQ